MQMQRMNRKLQKDGIKVTRVFCGEGDMSPPGLEFRSWVTETGLTW
jgi:hypothetical protein